MGCVYAEESAIITSLHNLFPCDYSELFFKKQCCREMPQYDTVIGWLRFVLAWLKFFGERTSGRSGVLRARRPGWFNRETEGLTPRNDWLSCLVDLWVEVTSNKSPHIVRPSHSCSGAISPKKPKGTRSDGWLRRDIRISDRNQGRVIIWLFIKRNVPVCVILRTQKIHFSSSYHIFWHIYAW